MKHTAKANEIITELKAMYSGAGACRASSSAVTVTSIINGKGQNPGGTVAENLGSTPKRPRFSLSAGKNPKDLFQCLTLELKTLRELDLSSSQLLALVLHTL